MRFRERRRRDVYADHVHAFAEHEGLDEHAEALLLLDELMTLADRLLDAEMIRMRLAGPRVRLKDAQA